MAGKFSFEPSFELAGDQPSAVEGLVPGPRSRRPVHNAARSHRHGEDGHDGGSHREARPPGARHGAEQDAGGPAGRRVPGVLPRTTPSSTSSATTTTTSPRRTSRRRTPTSRRTRRSTTRSTGCVTPRRRRSSLVGTAIVVASVSCIYGLGTPEVYEEQMLYLHQGSEIPRDHIVRRLVDLSYQRNDSAVTRGRFRVRGDTLEVHPAYEEQVLRVEMFGDEIEKLHWINPVTGEVIGSRTVCASIRRATTWPATRPCAERSARSRTSSRSGWRSSRARTSSSKRSGCECGRTTTSR